MSARMFAHVDTNRQQRFESEGVMECQWEVHNSARCTHRVGIAVTLDTQCPREHCVHLETSDVTPPRCGREVRNRPVSIAQIAPWDSDRVEEIFR